MTPPNNKNPRIFSAKLVHAMEFPAQHNAAYIEASVDIAIEFHPKQPGIVATSAIKSVFIPFTNLKGLTFENSDRNSGSDGTGEAAS